MQKASANAVTHGAVTEKCLLAGGLKDRKMERWKDSQMEGRKDGRMESPKNEKPNTMSPRFCSKRWATINPDPLYVSNEDLFVFGIHSEIICFIFEFIDSIRRRVTPRVHKLSYLIFFRKLGKMSQNLSSAAVVIDA